jgi:hypothetical protein
MHRRIAVASLVFAFLILSGASAFASPQSRNLVSCGHANPILQRPFLRVGLADDGLMLVFRRTQANHVTANHPPPSMPC